MSKLAQSLRIFKAAVNYSIIINVQDTGDVKYSGGRLTISGLNRDEAAQVKKGLQNWAKSISFSGEAE